MPHQLIAAALLVGVLAIPQSALAQGPRIEVEVVDDSGSAVEGVGVILMPRLHGVFDRSYAARARAAAAVTDSEGRAVLDLESWRLHDGWIEPSGWIGYPPHYDRTDVAVVLDVPSAPPLAAHLDLTAGPPPRVRLVLTPVGEIAFEVRGPDGRPAPDGTQVVIRPVGDPAAEAHPIKVAVSQGRARAPFLLVGQALAVTTEAERFEPAALLSHPGPSRKGDAEDARLTLGAPYPVLSGQLVQRIPAGTFPMTTPVARQRLAGRLTHSEGEPLALEAFTDDRGAFEIVVREPGRFRAAGGVRLALWVEPPVYGIQAWIPPERSARAHLAGPLAPGPRDLGTLALEPEPILVSGTVVRGPDRTPAAGETVEVRLHRQGERHPHLFLLATDEAGRFVLHGDAFDGHLEVRAGSVAARDVRPGTEDLAIEL